MAEDSRFPDHRHCDFGSLYRQRIETRAHCKIVVWSNESPLVRAGYSRMQYRLFALFAPAISDNTDFGDFTIRNVRCRIYRFCVKRLPNLFVHGNREDFAGRNGNARYTSVLSLERDARFGVN